MRKGLRTRRVGDRLPALPLSDRPVGGGVVPGATSRDALVLLLLPRGVDAFADYLRALDEAAADIEHWYARVLVITACDAAAADAVRAQLTRLTLAAQPDAAVHDALGIEAGNAAVVIADRYGQIYFAAAGARADDLPDAREIEEWTKFLATQCPECGVLDEPGYGEWSG